MEIQELTEFQLKITIIGEAISKKVILPKFRPYVELLWPKLFPKIARFERISKFYDLKHGNTSTDLVSAQNYPNW